jgi:hypothetical protein
MYIDLLKYLKITTISTFNKVLFNVKFIEAVPCLPD